MNWKRVPTAAVLIPFAVALVLWRSTAPYLYLNAHLEFFPHILCGAGPSPLARRQGLEDPGADHAVRRLSDHSTA